MKFTAGALVGAGISILVGVGCGGGGSAPPEESVVGTTRQALAFVPPINGGALLLAGTGARGYKDATNPQSGMFNDPVAVYVSHWRTYPYEPAILVADWGNNSLRSITESNAGMRAGLQLEFGSSGPNLLANPRAEQPNVGGAIVGWVSPTGGGTWTATSLPRSGGGDPADGNNLFYAGNSATNATLYQDVDVSTYAHKIDSSGLDSFCFTGWSAPTTRPILIQRV